MNRPSWDDYRPGTLPKVPEYTERELLQEILRELRRLNGTPYPPARPYPAPPWQYPQVYCGTGTHLPAAGGVLYNG